MKPSHRVLAVLAVMLSVPLWARAMRQLVAMPVIQDAATPLPVEIPASSSRIRYMGRFDKSDSKGPRCSWSASAVQVAFHGSVLNVRLNESGDSDRYEVVVDGKPTAVLRPQPGEHLYRVFHSPSAPGPHTVLLMKRTESFFGITQFKGFQVSQGGELSKPPPAPRHRIEIVGDSISCGYGNEAANQNEHFTPDTENAYLTYGAITARRFGADYTCLAWSGRKMWPDNTMGEIYGRTLATDPNSRWDFSKARPDVVVITLATNDFGKGTPDHAGWVAGYRSFIARVRKNYLKAAIYCATSPMMSGESARTVKTWLNEIVSAEHASGNKRVRLLEFQTQKMENGLGADWHPSVKTHQIMADKLTATLSQDLGWKAR